MDQFNKDIIIEKRNAEDAKIQNSKTSDVKTSNAMISNLKEYISLHPDAISGIFSGYKDDIESMLDSAGIARPLVEASIKDKCPWLFDAVYGDAKPLANPLALDPDNSTMHNDNEDIKQRHQPSNFDPRRHERIEDEIEPDTPEFWEDVMKYAHELRQKGMKPARISDMLWKDYRVDWSVQEVTSQLYDYIPEEEVDNFKPSIRQDLPARQDDKTINIVKGLLDKNKSLEEKIIELNNNINNSNDKDNNIGLIRKFMKWLY